MRIKKIVKSLIDKYGTSNPFELAEYNNIEVMEFDLHPDIYGLYKYIRRNKFIFINSSLDYEDKVFTGAHELGHSQLHPRLNTPFLRKNTFVSTNKIETEANKFAVELLLSDKKLYEYRDTNLTINEVANIYGIPKKVAHLKNTNFFDQ